MSFSVLAILGTLVVAPLAAAQATVLAADGSRHAGALTSDGRTVQIGGAQVPLDRVVVVRLAAVIASQIDQGVVLADGDVIAGVVAGVQNEQVEFASDRFGTRTLTLSQVAGLALAPQPIATLGRVPDEPAGARLINGDRLAGTLAFLNPVAAGINTGKRIVELPRPRLALLRSASVPPPPSSSVQRLRLVTGERLSGVVKNLAAGTLTLTHAVLGEVSVPLPLVATWWSEGGALTPLTSVPATVNQSGLFGPPPVARAPGAHNDGPLNTVTGLAEHALKVAADGDLTFPLDGVDRLVGEVALAPRHAGRGDAVARLVGDGRVLAEIPLAGGTVHHLDVPLAGVRRLSLITDAGPDGVTTGDEVAWSWLTLVRAR